MDTISGSAQVDRFCFSYQYEVVCFGFGIAVMCCQLLQHFIAFSMGDMYRYRNDTSKLKHVSIRWRLFTCVCRESGRLLPLHTSARQMLHTEDRGSSTGDAFFCAAAA